MFRRVLKLTLAGALLSAPMSCTPLEPRTALGYAADAKHAYENAMIEFKNRDWIDAAQLFREVKRKYAYSRYARLSELRLADADFEQEKYTDALRAYRQFIHDHRTDTEDVAYARSKIAEGEYKQVPDSYLLGTAEERDQAGLLDAYKELRNFVHDYPDSAETAHIHKLLLNVTGRLIKHELSVARFYIQRDNYEAAATRVQYALRNFALSRTEGAILTDDDLAPDAWLLLGEVLLKQQKWSDAAKAFETIVGTYSESPLSVQARNYLEKMNHKGG